MTRVAYNPLPWALSAPGGFAGVPANAYSFNPPQLWRTSIKVPEGPPLPLPETYRAPYMPNIIDSAAMDRRAGGTPQQQIRALELASFGSLEAALARLGRAIIGARSLPSKPRFFLISAIDGSSPSNGRSDGCPPGLLFS